MYTSRLFSLNQEGIDRCGCRQNGGERENKIINAEQQQRNRTNSIELNCPVIGSRRRRTKHYQQQLDKHLLVVSLLTNSAILLLYCCLTSADIDFVVAAEPQQPTPDLSLPPLPPLANDGGSSDIFDDRTDETPSDINNSNNNNDNNDDPNQVSPCEVCRLVVTSFEKGMEQTARGKHEGGDTSWEEKNLKSYADSEVRLVEIQEQICEGLPGGLKGKAQCLSLAEDTELDVEEWWFKHRNKNVRLHDYLCISKLKRCCADAKFGPTCQPCPSDCNKHGSCDGSGTRSGTGKCNCESGYYGEECSGCTPDYFRVATSDHFACLKCDSACSGCYGPGQTNCTECREGYYKHELNGCIDINECDIGTEAEGNTRLCRGNTYCINTDGSYRCADCHVACSRCIGYGPNMCISCARGYDRDDEYSCRSNAELEKMASWEREESLRDQGKTSAAARYFFYAGVLIISMTIFGIRSNLYVMCFFIVGFVVFLLLSEASFKFKVDLKYSESSSE